MGYAAQQFGPQFANAEYFDRMPARNERVKNLLIIGPNAIEDSALLPAAPSAFRLALRGKSATGQNTLRVASFERYASNSENIAIQQLAQQLSKDTRVQTSGIASLFASPYSDKHLIGVITSIRPSQFAKAMHSLTKPGYWNGLQGSVARWNGNTIMMAQTASALSPSYVKETPKLSLPKAIAAKWETAIDYMRSRVNPPNHTSTTTLISRGTIPGPQMATEIELPALQLRGAATQKAETRPLNTHAPLILKAKSMFQNGYLSNRKTPFHLETMTRKWSLLENG